MEVYLMAWREFQLRLYGYKRKELNEWYKVREIAYSATIGAHLNPKKIPKTKELFMPLGGDRKKKRVSEQAKSYFLNAYKKYLNERQVKI